MGRSESHQVAEQGMQQSAQDQANAQAALASTNSSIGNYNTNLNNFLRFGRSVYGTNGEYMADQNALANTTAAAGTTKMSGDLALNAARTGENTANYAPTVAESQRQSERDLTNQLATADASRLQNLMAVNQYGVEGSKFPAQVYEGMYGTGTQGSSGQLNPAANAAKTPGFWDVFAPALAEGAGQAAGGFAKACWIAAALYGGWYEPRTVLIREWLNTEFMRTWIGRAVMRAYRRYGKQLAAVLPEHPGLRKAFQFVFDQALAKAMQSKSAANSQQGTTR